MEDPNPETGIFVLGQALYISIFYFYILTQALGLSYVRVRDSLFLQILNGLSNLFFQSSSLFAFRFKFIELFYKMSREIRFHFRKIDNFFYSCKVTFFDSQTVS